MAQPSFAKAMAPVRVVAPRLVRCMISRSRPQKPMPPNGRWRPSANRSGLSFIARTGTYPPSRAAVPPATSSPPMQPRVGFHPDDTTPIPRPSHYYGRRHHNSMTALLRQDLAKTEENAPAVPLLVPAPRAKSTKANSSSPSLSGCAIRLTEIRSLTALHSLRAATVRSLITSALHNRGPSVSRSAMSSPCRSAAGIIGNCIRPVTRLPGGRT